MARAISIADLDLSFRYDGGELEVLRDLSLEAEEGEFVSIIGPSGCGKTTLLRVIGGLQDFNSGSVFLGGESPTAARKRRAFAYVFQNPVLFRWRTVLQNVLLPSEVFAVDHPVDEKQQSTDPERIAREMIDLVGLKGFENARPSQLSGGMQSRVALARALSYHPDVLLMDEPFGDLDEFTRSRMNSELTRLWIANRSTVIFVTHSIHEAIFLSDKVAVMTSRPSRIKEIIGIEIPRPRDQDIVSSSMYLSHVNRLRQILGLELS
jgi:NitT/TauT family transport system ATP-binding protein